MLNLHESLLIPTHAARGFTGGYHHAYCAHGLLHLLIGKALLFTCLAVALEAYTGHTGCCQSNDNGDHSDYSCVAYLDKGNNGTEHKEDTADTRNEEVPTGNTP